ncbi:putative transferase, protein kinase RLK-Pelle-WAK-LRK10L-1 family [Lupinus albus]|uniref:Putative transferase, protein kinase RLK-Pelle-WAK-LRK10L-1 family n=1 Tax=Lupinus albus TaxID=3870 RepID=A0A6A4PUB5_LUPAL|nr:putative transferase, protein kinase RLK-Pelle-WAK-LRK10L-1 family [Lupinus albus]
MCQLLLKEDYQCYKLIDKSDVYSFGVVLIEIISSLQAVDVNRHRNDVNLANMAVNNYIGKTNPNQLKIKPKYPQR